MPRQPTASAMAVNYADIAAATRRHLVDAFTLRIDVSRARFSIAAVICMPSLSPWTGKRVLQITAQVTANNRDLLVGRSTELESGSRDGHITDFATGFVTARLDADGLLPKEVINIVSIDVAQDDQGEMLHRSRGLYKYRSHGELLSDGFLVSGSPIDVLLTEYGLQYMLTSGRIVCGPSYGLLLETAALVRDLQQPRVLDMFSGPGCLSRVALQSGASLSIAVDIVLPEELLAANLGEFRPKCVRAETNLEDFSMPHEVEIIVCDPFYETSIRQMSIALPRLVDACDWLIVNLGPTSHPRWCDSLRDLIRRYLPARRELVHGMERIGVFGHGK